MQTQQSDRYSVIGETTHDECCAYCGGATCIENPVLLFSAANRPTVAVHWRCYIHWAYQQPVPGEHLA